MANEAFPPSPPFNFTSHHAVDLAVDLPTAYDRLGRLDHLDKVIGLSPVAQNISISPVEEVPGDGKVEALRDIYNLPVRGGEEAGTGFKRAKFTFREAMNYGGIFNVNVDLVGSQVEAATPNLDPKTGQATVLYESYSKQHSIWIHKRRTFTLVGDGTSTRVEEYIEGACGKWMSRIVQPMCRSSHQGHMLSFGQLFEGNVKAVKAPVSDLTTKTKLTDKVDLHKHSNA